MKFTRKRQFKIGVVGLGFGASVHAPALIGLSDVDVVGIAGRTIAKAQKVAKSIGIPKGYGSIEELLNQDLDAITLALPPDQVTKYVKTAINYRVPILCEKPFGTDASVSKKISLNTNDLTNGINFLFAELKTFSYLKKVIDNGKYGKVRHANLLWLHESWVHRKKISSWKINSEKQGGVISLLGSHVFYLLEWLFGSAKNVHANAICTNTNFDVPVNFHLAEDLVSCRFKLTSGILFNCTFGNANPGISIHRWTIVFDNCTIIVENNKHDYTDFTLKILSTNSRAQILKEPFYRGDGRIPAFRCLAQRFINSVTSGSSFQPDFTAGARVQFIDEKVRMSAQLNKSVDLD
ncbi:Gfo/Idh/MocA family oxidoreductase [Alphaproteobacteria bacterium]|nr:Gfo/Idh/MocA family oxidoreductase [Alphaproteobacteria bacterium]